MCASVGVHRRRPIGQRTLGEIDERRREETGATERKDRRANLPGLLLARRIFSRWGGRDGEVKARLTELEEVQEVLTHSEDKSALQSV